MPTPTVNSLTVTFPESCKYVIGSKISRTVIDIVPGDVVLDACTNGTESKTINWKQATAGSSFYNCNRLSYVQRTAISNASAIVDSVPVNAANVKTNARGMIYTDLVVADPLKTASVTYNYKRERMDLIEVDALGVLHVVKGTESDFAASEFMPAPTDGRYPLFYCYVWNDTVEIIDAHSWSGVSPKSPRQKSRIASLQSYNAGRTQNLRAAISSGAVTIAGYGDSITAVGGGWAATGGADDTTWLDDVPNNQSGFVTRDSSNFLYWHDSELRNKYTELGSVWPQVSLNDVGWGLGRQIKSYIENTYAASVTWKNWGIGGTTSGTGNSGSIPNGGETTRLANFNASSFNAVFVNFQMNDFVGFATSDLYTPLSNLVSSLKSSHPQSDIILMGAPGINVDNTNLLAWLQRADEIYRQVARAQNVAYVPTYIVTHDDPGYLQISRYHYSGGNRYNHQTPYELRKLASWAITVLGL